MALELKTINTNYGGVYKDKHRPVTKNIEGVLKDIEKSRKTHYEHKLIIFIVYPLDEIDKNKWQSMHLSKIKNKLRSLKECQFKFKNGISGFIYLGLV